MTQPAVVVFLGRDLVDKAAWWSRFLKPGFVHCFVLIGEMHWIKIESKYGQVSITQLVEAPIADVVAYYRNQGAIVVETTVRSESVRSPFVVRTCVGLVKAMIGIKSFSLTPFGLYKYLEKHA